MASSSSKGRTPLILRVALAAPFTLAASVLAVALVCSYFGVQFFNLSDPDGGLRIRDSLEAQRADGWIMSLSELFPDQGEGQDNERRAQQSESDRGLTIMYVVGEGSEDKKKNVFTIDNVAKMAALEDAVVAAPNYTSYCHIDLNNGGCSVPRSPVPYLRGAKTQVELDKAVSTLYNEGGELIMGRPAPHSPLSLSLVRLQLSLSLLFCSPPAGTSTN